TAQPGRRKRMNIFRAVGVLMGMLIAACVAHAYPTLAGFTGNGVLPTGDIVPMNQVQVAVDYYNTEDNDTDLGDSIPIRILYGASPTVEVGVGYMPLEFLDEDANTWNVNARLATDLRLGGFTWGLGARYASTHVDVVDDTEQPTYLYIAGTRTFSRVDADI